jgi:hypothetical protein
MASRPRGVEAQAASLLPQSRPCPSSALANGLGPNWVRQEQIWSSKVLHPSSLGVGSTRGGGKALLAAGIKPFRSEPGGGAGRAGLQCND